MDRQNLLCCGLQEISGISAVGSPAGAKEALLLLLRQHGGIRGLRSAVIFTGASPDKVNPPAYARIFAQYIEDNNLGTVYLIPRLHRNKNSGNYISTYVWHVKPTILGRWFRANG